MGGVGALWGTRVMEIVKKHDSGGLVWKRIKLTTTRKANAKKRLLRVWQPSKLPLTLDIKSQAIKLQLRRVSYVGGRFKAMFWPIISIITLETPFQRVYSIAKFAYMSCKNSWKGNAVE
ncbi:hypothetical protein CsSME_00004725 [Camellia sinensis var. sinensis]